MSRFLLIIFVALVFAGCQNNESEELKSFKQEIKERGLTFDKATKHLVIIPEGGCGGCIASGISFIVSHKGEFSKEQDENVVVFTNIGSLKLLKRAVGNDVFNSVNHIVDIENKYLFKGEDELYPMIIYLEKGKPVDVGYQSPFEEGLNKLESEL